MKRLLPVLLAVLILPGIIAMTTQKTQKIVFFGDSITQQGAQPGGYISLINDMLDKKGAKGQYELIGAGIGGNKVYDLFLRMEDDVLAKNPDIVVVYVGVNDVWHKSTSGTGTDPDKFLKFYTAIIKKLKEKNCRVILCTPAVIGEKTDFSNQQDGDMNKYAQFIRGLSKTHNTQLVDLRSAFLDYNLKNNTENKELGILTTDRVHLNDKGNQLVADLVLRAIQQKGVEVK